VFDVPIEPEFNRVKIRARDPTGRAPARKFKFKEMEMKVMLLGRANRNTEEGIPPTPEAFEAMEKFNDELVKAGVLLEGGGLHPTSKAKRVRFVGGKATVIDGPFTESKELVAGYQVWQVKSMEEAVEWVKKAKLPEGEVEIRQIFSPEDFADVAPQDAEVASRK
jgi:hypothetical protein